jgi:pantetheine-phosphate adenylyltransferase
VSHDGLVTDFAIDRNVDFLVRGVRSFRDFESELNLSAINRDLILSSNRRIETIFLPCDAKYAHISSSLIRELAQFKRRHSGVLPASIEGEVFDYLIKH